MTRQTQQLLCPLLSLCLHHHPTYLHPLPGFICLNQPATPPLVQGLPCKSIPLPRPLSHPVSLQLSLYTCSSRELLQAPAQLSQTQTAPRGHTHYCSNLLQISSSRGAETRGTLSPSPLNLSGCRWPTCCTLHSNRTK